MALPDLTRRTPPSELPELMDGPCTFEQMRGCLRDIALVNRLTFAYRPTLHWLDRLPPQPTPLRIVDVGCGFGDGLRRIARWAARRRVAVVLTGIDLNEDAIRAAREATPAALGVRFVVGDALSPGLAGAVDVVVSALLTHHLEETEVVRFLRWMEATARVGWFVNDLQRAATPYRAFQALIAVWPFHPFVKQDGLVSIRRSFQAEDWMRMAAAAGLAGEAISIQGFRPARLCVGRARASPLLDSCPA